MKDLEAKLKELPLRQPSSDLDDRVVGQKQRHPPSHARLPRRVPIWVNAAVAATMAVAGFVAGRAWPDKQPRPQPQPAQPVTLHYIYSSPSTGNPFDFTRASDVFPTEKLETKTDVTKGA